MGGFRRERQPNGDGAVVGTLLAEGKSRISRRPVMFKAPGANPWTHIEKFVSRHEVRDTRRLYSIPWIYPWGSSLTPHPSPLIPLKNKGF